MATRSRRAFVSLVAASASFAAMQAHAQFGGGRMRGGDSSSTRSKSGDSRPRSALQTLNDPLAAIQRELPSLQIDLKLSSDQAALFDSFARQVHTASDAERQRMGHVSALLADDGSNVAAATVIGTIADDDEQRADASRAAVDSMAALYAALTPDQQRQFDRRILLALRDPLGTS
jgi:hypothetical protein